MSELPHDGLDSVVHCFRAPVGGIFRHVCDLASGQSRRGLSVGIICDAATGGEHAGKALEQIEPLCKLGVHRVQMRRSLHFDDLRTYRRLSRICRRLRPSIVHGHGAKGGAFARLLPAGIGAKVIYTPHGGVLHYDKGSLAGTVYFSMERYLARATHGIVFASHFGRAEYENKIGEVSVPHTVIHNGLRDDEFLHRNSVSPEYDFVFAGELRMLKGVDTLLQAVARLGRASLLIHGDGPDASFFTSRVRELGVEAAVTMLPPIFPVSAAFAKARCVVVPSHQESFPYIVLEAAAAGVPLVATRAGGIPEIFGAHADRLVAPDDVEGLTSAMAAVLEYPQEARDAAARLAKRVSDHFRVGQMIEDSLAFYQRTLGT